MGEPSANRVLTTLKAALNIAVSSRYVEPGNGGRVDGLHVLMARTGCAGIAPR
ncbi:MAG: hypothetical protein ABIU96_07390 [Rhodanobacter sp.]